MIWIVNFPLPPSVNEYLMPVVPRGSSVPRLVKTEVHRKYMHQCHLWRAQNSRTFWRIEERIKALKSLVDSKKGQFALRVDAHFVFHTDRIKANDANNRLKPVLDGLVEILGVDDRYFYAGNCEKVSTRSKESECSILRISPMQPRTLEMLRDQIARETSIQGT